MVKILLRPLVNSPEFKDDVQVTLTRVPNLQERIVVPGGLFIIQEVTHNPDISTHGGEIAATCSGLFRRIESSD